MEQIEHFFVMVGQLLDDAMIGAVLVRLTLSDGRVVEGVPVEPASAASRSDELDDTGYVRWIDIGGVRVELAAVRQAAIVHPCPVV